MWHTLDSQMTIYGTELIKSVKLNEVTAGNLASTIAKEVDSLPLPAKNEIRRDSPIPIEIQIEELRAFQEWMELANSIETNPAVTRAQVICLNYICFVHSASFAWRPPVRSTSGLFDCSEPG